MILLYQGSGASGFELVGEPMPEERWQRIATNAARLLLRRGQSRAAELLSLIPFSISEGSNYFGDDFYVLHATVPLDDYEEMGALKTTQQDEEAFMHVAYCISEVGGPFIRFICIYPELVDVPAPVSTPKPHNTTAVVDRALLDAENLLATNGPISAMDRAHTALHGYMKNLCEEMGVAETDNKSITEFFKILRTKHPAFTSEVTRSHDVDRVLKSFASILDAMNTFRNQSSLAHPNNSLLAEAEAMLVINSARSLLHYINQKMLR
ncbi:MAG: abortive infection family protein [Patescibacteria group bacterium]